MRYTVKGFTGPNPDFTDTIEMDACFDWHAIRAGDQRYSAAYNALKRALIDSACDSDYLGLLDDGQFEVRPDLADNARQVVLVGEALGCDNCQENHGCNEYTDGCDDAPHGGYMLTFDPVDCDGVQCDCGLCECRGCECEPA